MQPVQAGELIPDPYMAKDEMAAHMEAIFRHCHELRDKAHHEYAHGQNALDNFVRLGKQLQLPPEKVLMVYFQKHLDGITAAVNGHWSQRESVHGRIQDAIVYLTLLDAIFTCKERFGQQAISGLIPQPPLKA